MLRYGGFYGPGTSLGSTTEASTSRLPGRKFPIVGGGGGVWSFVHIEDAAEATAIAVRRGVPGIYNVVDDQPAAVRDWLRGGPRARGKAPAAGCRGGSAGSWPARRPP